MKNKNLIPDTTIMFQTKELLELSKTLDSKTEAGKTEAGRKIRLIAKAILSNEIHEDEILNAVDRIVYHELQYYCGLPIGWQKKYIVDGGAKK